jgi:hypothetical protein
MHVPGQTLETGNQINSGVGVGLVINTAAPEVHSAAETQPAQLRPGDMHLQVEVGRPERATVDKISIEGRIELETSADQSTELQSDGAFLNVNIVGDVRTK